MIRGIIVSFPGGNIMIDLFCHKNVLSWKDRCDEERRGERLN